MADPLIAIYRTKGAEGAYSNHPNDSGGETLWGISRNNTPTWFFWESWDVLKQSPDPWARANLDEVKKACLEWYEMNPDSPWSKIRGSEIPSQWIADELFDTATNAYHLTAAEFLQRTLNILNRSDRDAGLLWEELEVRGGIGPRTLGALREALARGMGPEIWKYLNALQGAFYVRIAELNPSLEAFTRGWAKRIFERDLSQFQ